MAFFRSTIRKIVFWNYERNTWQWDILCVVILIFIFVTPKGWFASSERPRSWPHQSPTSTLLVGSEVVENAEDKGKLQERVRTLAGRPKAEVLAVRKVFDKDGKERGYEVDIR